LMGVMGGASMAPMTRTQVHRRDEELPILREIAKHTNRSVSALIREAVRQVWLRSPPKGPFALWNGQTLNTSANHDSVYDSK
jgi:hypothetical protein